LKNILNKNTLIIILISTVIFLVGTLFGSKNSQLFSKKTYDETCLEIIEKGRFLYDRKLDSLNFGSITLKYYTYEGKLAYMNRYDDCVIENVARW